jgi:D-3-phosphoglycerate dehydrogenase
VRLALLVGALEQGSDTPVNFVSAPRLARERGLMLVERPESDAHFLHGLLRRARRAQRDVLRDRRHGGRREPRVVRIDDHSLDLRPSGPLLLTTHDDQPGVVGLLGTVLGKHGVNIRRIELGPGETAADGLGAWLPVAVRRARAPRPWPSSPRSLPSEACV